jgi:hypothetical protein
MSDFSIERVISGRATDRVGFGKKKYWNIREIKNAMMNMLKMRSLSIGGILEFLSFWMLFIVFSNFSIEELYIFFEFYQVERVAIVEDGSFLCYEYNIEREWVEAREWEIIKSSSPEIPIYTSFGTFRRQEYPTSSMISFVGKGIGNPYIRKERLFFVQNLSHFIFRKSIFFGDHKMSHQLAENRK